MLDSGLDKAFEISEDQNVKIRRDLTQVSKLLKIIEGYNREVYVVKVSYLDPQITVTERTQVSLKTYLKRIKGALENGLNQGKFSLRDAYFLKFVSSPYLSDVPITELERALKNDSKA